MGFEIRPDVLALLLLTASWLALAAASNASLENRATLLVSLAGLAMALRRAVRRLPRAVDLLPVAAAGSLLAGAFIVPAPLDQYFLPLMPPVAWLAADVLVALVRPSSSGRRAEWLLVGALTVLLFEPLLRLAQRLRSPGSQGRAALERVRWVIDNTETRETVLDGFSGAGVFRPHACFYFGSAACEPKLAAGTHHAPHAAGSARHSFLTLDCLRQ